MKHWWLAMLLMAAPVRAEVVAVAAAADLRRALPAIAQAFTARTGDTLAITYGSSGQMAAQIRQGGPWQAFLSADAAPVAALCQAQRCAGRPQAYARGRLALVARRPPVFDVAGGLPALAAALKAGRVRHLAIADPGHAPYGARAAAVLAGAGINARAQLVQGANVGQALQYVATGAAEAGVVALPLLGPDQAATLAWAPIPAAAHPPLVQQAVTLRGSGPAARRFLAFLASPPAQRILAAHGFDPP